MSYQPSKQPKSTKRPLSLSALGAPPTSSAPAITPSHGHHGHHGHHDQHSNLRCPMAPTTPSIGYRRRSRLGCWVARLVFAWGPEGKPATVTVVLSMVSTVTVLSLVSSVTVMVYGGPVRYRSCVINNDHRAGSVSPATALLTEGPWLFRPRQEWKSFCPGDDRK